MPAAFWMSRFEQIQAFDGEQVTVGHEQQPLVCVRMRSGVRAAAHSFETKLSRSP